MREELKVGIVNTTFILSIISVALTILDINLFFILSQLVLAIIALILGIYTYIKQYKKTSYVSVVLSTTAIVIGLIFLWLYLV